MNTTVLPTTINNETLLRGKWVQENISNLRHVSERPEGICGFQWK